MPVERARTLLVLGQVLRRRKQRREARAAFEEALDVFEHVGRRRGRHAPGASSHVSRCVVRRPS